LVVLPSMMATQELVVPRSIPMIFPMMFYSGVFTDVLDVRMNGWFSSGPKFLKDLLFAVFASFCVFRVT
jgi:hypothetical protein